MDDGLGSRVFAEVLGLVSAEKTGGLNLGRRSSRKFLVEADDTLHTNGIGSSADGIWRSDLRRDEGRKAPTSDEAHCGRGMRSRRKE